MGFSDPILILNSSNIQETYPPNFRKVQNSFYHLKTPFPSREGLNDLSISGSGQFSENELKFLLRQIQGRPLIMIDLREEPHGFINGNAVSWYVPRNWANANVPHESIEMREQQMIDRLALERTAIISKVEKSDEYPLKTLMEIPIDVLQVSTERDLCLSMQIGYFRLPMRDHMHPSSREVDRYLLFLRELPENTWLHFHCSRGMGRSTAMMVMYDILKNGQKLSLEEISERQWLLGGKRLSRPAPPFSWKHTISKHRWRFMEQFYQFAKEYANNPTLTWSQWYGK